MTVTSVLLTRSLKVSAVYGWTGTWVQLLVLARFMIAMSVMAPVAAFGTFTPCW